MSAKQCCLQYCFQIYFHHIALRVYHPVTNFNQQCPVKTTPVTLYKHVSEKKKILNEISSISRLSDHSYEIKLLQKISITKTCRALYTVWQICTHLSVIELVEVTFI